MALNFINNGYVAGRLGIGRINPAVPLDVEGKIRSNDFSSGDYFEIFCDGSVSGDSYIENTSNNIQIKSAFATSFSTSGSEAMFITNSQKVGIGTDSPTAKLTVSSDVGGDGTWVNSGILIENSASSAECAVVLKNAETGSNYWFTGLNQSNIYKIGYGTGFVNTNVFLQINNTGTLTLDGYNLANKTGTPTYMLGTDVDGNVVKVLGGSIPGGGTVTGSGTATYLPKWGSTGSDLTDSSIYENPAGDVRVGKSTATAKFLIYPDQTNSPTNKKYLFTVDGSSTGVGLGFWGGIDATYTSVVEGIKLLLLCSYD